MFDYKQRGNTKEYRDGHERTFGGKEESLIVRKLRRVWQQVKEAWAMPITTNYPHGVIGQGKTDE